MYITNTGAFLDTWNKMLKLLEILLRESPFEGSHTSFLHEFVRLSNQQEPKMRVSVAPSDFEVMQICLHSQACEILVRAVLYRLRQTCSQANVYTDLLRVLLTLCECRNGNDRPVCTYLVGLSDWLSSVALQNGKSLQRMTLLSPVFYISCFAEDDIELLVAQLDKVNEHEQDDDVSPPAVPFALARDS